MQRSVFAAAGTAAWCAFCPVAGAQLSFTLLGGAPGEYSSAQAVSADGSIVVGTIISPEVRGYRWTRETGRIIVTAAPGFDQSVLADVTGDGRVMAGRVADGAAGQAAIWVEGSAPRLLGGGNGFARGISDDGLVVVGGVSNANGSVAFRWTEAGGMVALGTVPGRAFSTSVATSSDGSVVVGVGYNPSGQTDRAFRWTEATGLVDIGTLSGRTTATAEDVSADGTVIVGTSAGGEPAQAFRWELGAGMVALPLPDGIVSSSASAISRDGTVIGGSISVGGPDHAYFWDSEGGHDLTMILGTLVPDGFVLSSIDAISDDGLTFAGRGMRGFQIEGWVATIPTPGSGVLAIGVLAMASRRRREPMRQ